MFSVHLPLAIGEVWNPKQPNAALPSWRVLDIVEVFTPNNMGEVYVLLQEAAAGDKGIKRLLLLNQFFVNYQLAKA